MGAKAYPIIEKYKDRLVGAVVEIGSERGEGSTAFLAGFCQANNLLFYSVDFEEAAHQRAQSIPHVRAEMKRGEDFLEELLLKQKEQICFAYLDNFDWIWEVGDLKNPESFYHGQIQNYAEHGLNMTNLNSQITHLRQAILLEKLAAHPSFILFDDTWQLEDGTFSGKGGSAIPYLLAYGYEMISDEISEPAVLLSRD